MLEWFVIHGFREECSDESGLFLADRQAVCEDRTAFADRHARQAAGRWIDAPAVYGPRKSLYNRYVRWAAKGVWLDLFHTLAQADGPPAQVLIDSSAVKAHRSAAGGKGGSKIRRSDARVAGGPPKSML